mgnify:FL=1
MGDPITDWLNSYKIPTHKVRQAGGDLVKSIGSKIRDKYRQLPDIPKRSMGAPGLGFSRPSIAKMDTFIEQRQDYYINTAREKPDDSPDLRNSFPNKVAELFRGQTMDTLSQKERKRINNELARWPVYLQQQALDMVKTGTVHQPTRQDLKKSSYDNEVEYTLPSDVLEAYKATQIPPQDSENLMDLYEAWIQPFAKWMAPQQQKYIPKEATQVLQAIRYISTLGQYAEEMAERDERRWAGREEITELYEEYRDEGLSEYEASEKAFDEVDLPKGDKLIQEFLYDPLWLVGAKPVTTTVKVAIKGAIKTPTVIRAVFPAMKAALSKQGLLNLPKKGETIITSIPSGIVKAAKGLPEIPEKIGKIITEKRLQAYKPVDPATLIPKLGNEAYDTAMFKTAADFDDPEKVLAALAQIRNKALTERKGYIDAAIEAGEVLPEFVDDAGKGFKVVPAEAITNAGKKAEGILQVTTPGGKIPVDPGWKWIASEILDGIPGIRNVRYFLKPALELVKTKSGVRFLTAHIAKNGVVSMLKTDLNGDSIILLHSLEKFFGPGSLKGNKITGMNKDGRLWVKLKPDDTTFSPELHPLGKKGGRRFSTREFTSKDGVEYEKVNTLFDVLQRPWLYALDANQIKVVRYFHQFHTDHLIKVNGEYKLGIKLFTPKGKDAAYVPNMDVSTEAKHLNDILQDIGNAGLTRSQFKTRYYNSGFDRWWHNPKFVPETNIRTLDAGLNSSKVDAVGKQIYRDLLGGKTKMDVFDELHPKLKALKLLIAKSLKKAKGRSERLLNNTQKFQIVNKADSVRLKRYQKAIKQLEGEGKLWHTGEPGYYSSEQGAQQWMQLNGKLAVLRNEASIIEKRLLSVKKPTESIAKEQELLLKEIEYLIGKNKELSNAYSTAGLGDYVLVKDQGLYRYFKADEAKAVTQLLDTMNNGFINFIENIRRTAFVADLSPIFGVQGPLHLFASPVQTTLDWVRGFRKGISQGDIFSAFDEKRLAMDIIENPESYREFAFYNGIELAGAAPHEFAIGYLSKIRFKGIGDKLAKKNEQLFSGMLRETRNLFNHTAKSLIEDGADPVQAKAVAATIAKSVNPMWDPFALGLSTKRAQQIRVLATSVSFITKPATLTKDAVMFMMKVGTKVGSAGTVHLGEITRREKQAFKILLNITMSTNAIAILSSTISALAQGKDVEEAVNEVVDPRSGKFMSIVIGDRRIPIGGPYRSIIKAMVPRDRINLMGGQSIKLPVPVPFAGVPGFFFNRITPAVKTQLDVFTNKDFYGDPIWRGAWYEAVARVAAYEVSGALPLTAAEFIRGPLSHHSIDDVTEQAAAQFFGVNLFQETPFQRRNEKVQEWAEEKRLPEIESY